MSWSIEINGKCKSALRKAARAQLITTYTEESQKKYLEPIAAVIDIAIEMAVLPSSADYLKVKSSGHADAGQRYFTIEVMPVYLPSLVDGSK